jgi:hypothetical protein
MLSQYDPKVSLFFGHRFILHPKNDSETNKLDEEGYMAGDNLKESHVPNDFHECILGGGYILSRKALMKFAELVKKTDMFDDEGEFEDVRMGRILSHSAIFVDCRDEFLQRRFLPVSFGAYLQHLDKPSYQWFYYFTYYNVSIGDLNCCSDVPIAFHVVKPKRMFLLEYLIYKVHAFGVDKNSRKSMPRKLKIEEIIAASDKRVFSPNFRDHVDYHNMTSSEYD